MNTTFAQKSLATLLCTLALGGLAPQAFGTEAGLQMQTLPPAGPGEKATPVALFYPTQAPARDMAMGPFNVKAAMYGPADEKFRGLIVLSHGIGGTELGHVTLAQALARGGYLVAALRHPGDNWQDGSLMQSGPVNYFYKRPGQVSKVIDALLADPKWKDRIASDERGPRIGALGHSAGGYSVVALAGGSPDLRQLGRHCAEEASQDPIFCGVGKASGQPVPATTTGNLPGSLRDERVRAVAALAPVGAPFSADSLARINIPMRIYVAGADRFLVPVFHGDYLLKSNQRFEPRRTPGAWHFAYMDKPTAAIPSADGDIAADPSGFDRQAFLDQLGQDLLQFFDASLK